MKRLVCLFAALLLIVIACSRGDRVVATVAGVKITEAELQRVLGRKMELIGQKSPTEKDRQETVAALVDRKIILMEGARLAIKPSESRIKGEMDKSVRNFPSREAFAATLKEEGLDQDGFRRETEENLIVEMVKEHVAAATKSDPESIRRYYEAHRKDFFTPPQYRIHLVQAGGEHEAMVMKEKIRRNPAEFNRLALEAASPDLKSINRNAVLTVRSEFPDEMLPLLDKLNKGEFGGPVKTRRGYFLVKLLDTAPAHQKTFDDVKWSLHHMADKELNDDAVRVWLEQQRKKVGVELSGHS